MPPPNNKSLLDRLKGKKTDELKNRVKVVEGLSEQDLSAATRADDHDLNSNWKQIKKISQWGLFACGAILTLVLTGALIALLYIYIADVLTNLAEVKSLLATIIQTSLVAVAALFIDHKFGKK